MRSSAMLFTFTALSLALGAGTNMAVGTPPAVLTSDDVISVVQAPPGTEATDAITIPRMLSYQGRLTDTLGNPVPNGNYQLTFRLYAVPSGGTAFWTENQNVATMNGLFSVLLGAVTPVNAVPGAGSLYLGMQVGASELTPRLRIVAAAYSYLSGEARRADTADYAITGGSADSAWVRGGDSVLYTIRQLGIARGGSQNMLHGNQAHTHANFGVACTTGMSGQVRDHCTVGGGVYNIASGNEATVSGGYANLASGQCAVAGGGTSNEAGNTAAAVGGGLYNVASGTFATVAGGQQNTASGSGAAVGGGGLDSAKATYGGVFSGYGNLAGDAASDTAACVAGGQDNSATAQYAFVGGGSGNVATGNNSMVAGGRFNAAGTTYATVAGGDANSARGFAATVGGGEGCSATDRCATVGGGNNNTASGSYAVVSGGTENTAGGGYASVGGGDDNQANFNCATVSGGHSNTAGSEWATVGGGAGNGASGQYATISGGSGNTASFQGATVAGGQRNTASGQGSTVGGGGDNAASDFFATVPGGEQNAARGYCSFAAGRWARANHTGSFVWSDDASASESLYTTGTSQFRVRARGGTWFFSNAGMTTGAYLAAGSNSWASACDSANKEDFRAVNRHELLERVAALRVRDYKMKDQSDGIRHIGPVAQDFHSAFGYGENNTSINLSDMDGIALAAIQALYADNQQLRQELEALKAELAERK